MGTSMQKTYDQLVAWEIKMLDWASIGALIIVLALAAIWLARA